MAGDDDDGARYVPVLLEYRVSQLEKQQAVMVERMGRLATSSQVAELKKTLEDRAARGFSFWVTSLGGPVLAGIIVGVILLVISHATGAGAQPR